jgi:GNAT superfamily N-acetyltransferase
MWWRERSDPEANRAAMEALVRRGATPGLLAYAEDVPVGWISCAPREGHAQLLRSRTYAPADTDAGVWAIVCVYVHPGARRARVAAALLDGAVAFARDSGARSVEAYPHADGARSDYMGSAAAFARRGFVPVEERAARVVMRLTT